MNLIPLFQDLINDETWADCLFISFNVYVGLIKLYNCSMLSLRAIILSLSGSFAASAFGIITQGINTKNDHKSLLSLTLRDLYRLE